ncbi:helix-turn-helix domain-containing protein [Actinomadura yumaensis]|uniref:helix-turn-helix domain-containing protein n=1 Tax=Actinomadura yumaensis TaxID=111807 RepID=UPI00361FAC15
MNSIERTIEAMQRNLSEQITVDDMARVAMFSKFYFTRIFRDSTGLSPGKFLSALRLQEAKRLLTATSLSIAEISNRVGYSSVGTFSSRFKTNVGVAPTVYRATGGLTPSPAATARGRAVRHGDRPRRRLGTGAGRRRSSSGCSLSRCPGAPPRAARSGTARAPSP